MNSRVPRNLHHPDGGTRGPSGNVLSPESALASEMFDQFVAAGTFKATLSTYRQICEILHLKPNSFPSFYPKLKAKLRSWKAANLWGKLDKRASQKCYNRGRACANKRLLIIGAGPCGLRLAIEAQLLGAKVVVLEKRDRFSRNNVLHLWPFVIHDLRNLGGKKFFGKFCAGSIDHISIRQLQLILLKVALLLGVEVHENVSFECLLEPPLDQSQVKVGWRARVTPADHPVAQYEFDVLIGADGKRNTLQGFNRKEFRGKLAIAITANFINRQSLDEARVQEISGVAFIFNQKFFQDMKEETGIDLENIVYYKDDTHYFVMTAKKQSLLEKGVIVRDYSDTYSLLSPDNVDRDALKDYARDAANFATDYQMPHVDFAVNHYGQADVAMFDFTSMYAAENACRILERRGHRLLQGLVGDSLLEPFWPTGSGCARGFLSAFDAAWMIRSWATGKMSLLQVLAEREAIYRLLAQTTPENLSKDVNQYTLYPSSRYPNLNLKSVLPSQVRCLCDTDSEIQDHLPDVVPELQRKKRRRISLIHPDALLSWCQRQVVHLPDIELENLSTSWKNGLALCAILHRYRPDLIDIEAAKKSDPAKNNQLAFDICEREYGIPPVMTGQEMADCEVPDKLAMVAYVTQIYDTFRGEIPYLVRPTISPNAEPSPIKEDVHPLSSPSPVGGEGCSKLHLPKIPHRKRYSLEKAVLKDKSGETNKRSKTPVVLTAAAHRRRSRLDKEKQRQEALLASYMKAQSTNQGQSFRNRMKSLQKQLKRDEGQRSRSEESDLEKEREEHLPYVTRRPQLIGKISEDDWNVRLLEEKLKNRGKVMEVKKTPSPKPARFKKDEWNIKLLEEKLKQQQAPPPLKENSGPRPKVLQEIFDSKLNAMDSRLRANGGLTEDEKLKFNDFDSSLKKLEQQLKEGTLESGNKGCNRVAAMAQHMAIILDWNPNEQKTVPSQPPPPVLPDKETVYVQPISKAAKVSGSERCCFCQKRVYLMERLSAEGLFFHRSCFRCDYCSANLRLGNYSFDRNDEVKFYCPPHYRMQKVVGQKEDRRFAEMMRRKHAFLSGSLEGVQLPKEPLLAANDAALEKVPVLETELMVLPEVPQAVTPTTIDESDSVPRPRPTRPNQLTLDEHRTPERVEFENSLLALSEDELITSELEEEELTQKNFGPSLEIATSEDDFSDLSTDTESDAEAYMEELQMSLTADGTRKLAETWQKRQRNSEKLTPTSPKRVFAKVRFLGEENLGSGDESSTPEAVSDTEEEGETQEEEEDEDTSEGIVTDDEYVYCQLSERDLSQGGRWEAGGSIRSDVVMHVPILEQKEVPSDSEESLESDPSDQEGLSDLDATLSDDTSTQSDEEPLMTPHCIPTIVINEEEKIETWEFAQESSVETSPATTDESVPFLNENSVHETTPALETKSIQSDLKSEELCSNKPLLEANRSLVEDEIVSDSLVTVISNKVIEDEVSAEPVEDLVAPKVQEEPLMAEHNPVDSTVKNVFASSRDSQEESQPSTDIVPSPQSRITMDKFKFIAGTNVSPLQTTLGGSNAPKLTPTSKELTFKLSEFRRKIEELQKQLPTTPKKSQPLEQDISRIRDNPTSVQDAQCDSYYQSILNKGEDKSMPSAQTNTLLNSRMVGDESSSPRYKLENSKSESALPKTLSVVPFSKILRDCAGRGDQLPETPMNKLERIKLDKIGENLKDANITEPVKLMPVNIDRTMTETVKTELGLSKKELNRTEPIKTDLSAEQFKKKDETVEIGSRKQLPYKIHDDFTSSTLPNPKKPTHTKPSVPNTPKTTDPSTLANPNTFSAQTKLTPSPFPLSEPKKTPTDARFQGYQGRFSEKVRPKSLVGDAIYLKFMDINVQKMVFPSLTKEASSFGGSCGSIMKERGTIDSDDSGAYQSKGSLNSRSTDNILLNSPKENRLKKNKTRETKSASPVLVAHKTRPLLPQMSKVEEKSPQVTPVLENVQIFMERTKEMPKTVPFVDEEIVSLAEFTGSYEEVFMTPGENLKGQTFYGTPPETMSRHDDPPLRSMRTVEQERAREQARERARMKSDEELGLSPCNYRKRYIQASSLSLGNYDELSSEDFLDDNEDMYDDDSIHELHQYDRNESLVKKIDFDETIATSSMKEAIKTDISIEATYSRQENDLVPSLPEQTPVFLALPRTNRVSTSTDSSPETLEQNLVAGKTKGKLKFKLDKKMKDTEEKGKNGSGKRSLFSLLHFGRSHESKGSKSRSSSLPPNASRSENKERSFLKFTKGSKERSSRGKSTDSEIKEPLNWETAKERTPKSLSEPPETKLQLEFPKMVQPSVTVPSYVPHRTPTPSAIKLPKESSLAPKASVDSYTDTEDDHSRLVANVFSVPPEEALKRNEEKEKRVQKLTQRIHHAQELKRFRTGQEIQRRLQEIEISRRELEKKGVQVEKALRAESPNSKLMDMEEKEDFDLMQEWFSLVRTRTKLEKEEQELTIRMKDLELEERHSQLQQKMRERMAISDATKSKGDIEKERDMLSEMLRIVEKRDELVMSLHQLHLEEEITDNSKIEAKLSPT